MKNRKESVCKLLKSKYRKRNRMILLPQFIFNVRILDGAGSKSAGSHSDVSLSSHNFLLCLSRGTK